MVVSRAPQNLLRNMCKTPEGEVVEAEKGRRPVSQVCGKERWGENENVEEFRICWQSPRFVKARVSAILFYPFAVLIVCLLSQF